MVDKITQNARAATGTQEMQQIARNQIRFKEGTVVKDSTRKGRRSG